MKRVHVCQAQNDQPGYLTSDGRRRLKTVGGLPLIDWLSYCQSSPLSSSPPRQVLVGVELQLPTSELLQPMRGLSRATSVGQRAPIVTEMLLSNIILQREPLLPRQAARWLTR